MTSTYRKEWGVTEAVREFAQNALDYLESESKFYLDRDLCSIMTPGYFLEPKHLRLGSSEKAKGSIGGFGEGFKIAMLVLTRLKKVVIIHSGDLAYHCYFEEDENLGEVFVIESNKLIEGYVEGMQVVVAGINEQEAEDVKEKLTCFSDYLGKPEHVNLVEGTGGRIYVNGLYVTTESQLKYSYNFNPEVLTLGCDRNVANAFDLAWETSKFWLAHPKEAFKLMELNSMDTHFCGTVSNPMFVQQIANLFKEKYGRVKVSTFGCSSGFTVGHAMYGVLSKSGKVATVEAELKPSVVLEKFIQENKGKHKKDILFNLKKLINKEATKWRTS